MPVVANLPLRGPTTTQQLLNLTYVADAFGLTGSELLSVAQL
jgi:hypothetical protein